MAAENPDAREPGQGSSVESAEEQTGYEGNGEDFAQADPDVLLDVPVVKVEELSLEVEDLKARVALRARLADLLEIEVGIDLSLSDVKLETKGVEAEARLKARLENVDSMIERTLSSVDNNPELIKDLTNMSEAASRSRRDDGPVSDIEEAKSEASASGGINATRAALSKAEELGVDLSELQGTGSGGRITVRDVREAAG